jgi:hypothetical protein
VVLRTLQGIMTLTVGLRCRPPRVQPGPHHLRSESPWVTVDTGFAASFQCTHSMSLQSSPVVPSSSRSRGRGLRLPTLHSSSLAVPLTPRTGTHSRGARRGARCWRAARRHTVHNQLSQPAPCAVRRPPALLAARITYNPRYLNAHAPSSAARRLMQRRSSAGPGRSLPLSAGATQYIKHVHTCMHASPQPPRSAQRQTESHA